MSLAAVIDSIGLVSGLLGVVGFIQDNLPEKPAQGASVRIKIGNPGDDNPGMDGDISHAYAWDFDNNYLGQADGSHVNVGDAATLTIDSFSPGSRADYIGVAAAKNAVCISWISVTMFDETPGGAWTGDIGYSCGQNWYEQGEMAGYLDDDQKEEYIPRCTWLDEDHSEGVPSAAMKFKVTAYGHDVEEVAKNGEGCKWTRYGPDNGPISEKPEKRSTNANRPRLPWMEKRLIMSNITSHKAENMCNSETSWGPDFVSPDGMYCDMSTKTLAPLCSTQNVQGCVDINEEERSVKKRSFVAKRQIDSTHRKYETIAKW